MNVIIITGFLGSGKTTLLSQALEYYRNNGQKFALIINEIGETGVDNMYFKQSGTAVREVLGGCVCCTSASEFKYALRELRETYEPDYVLIEPSGIANPVQIKKAVTDTEKKEDRLKIIALLDSERINLILDAVYPITLDTVMLSDTVVISKTDIASSDDIKKAEDFAHENNSEADIIKSSLIEALDQSKMEDLFRCRKI